MSFNAKSTFEPKALNWVVTICFADFNSILSFDDQYQNPINYEKEWCTFDKEKGHVKKQKKLKIVYLLGLNVFSLVKHHQFASNFEH